MLRIGILGAARIASSALLTPARERHDVKVTHVAASDAAREQAFADAHGLSPAGGYEAMLARSDLDLIYIALPPSAHCGWTLRALEAGKSVLCEKPFALDASEAELMVATAERTGMTLIEAFHYRFHPIIERMRDHLHDGSIGRISSAAANFTVRIPYSAGEFRWAPHLGGGAIMDLGCYPVHALRSLLDAEPTIKMVTARHDKGVDVDAEAVLHFAGVVDASIHCSMVSDTRRLDLEFRGDRGSLTLSNFVAPQFGSVLRLETAAGIKEETAPRTTSYAAQLAHVVDVMNGAAAPLTGGTDAVANMRVLDELRRPPQPTGVVET